MLHAQRLASIQRTAIRKWMDPRKGVHTIFGKVTSITTGNLRVQPDGMPTGDIGPLWKAANYTPAVDDRVMCVFDPGSRTYVVMFKIVNQP